MWRVRVTIVSVQKQFVLHTPDVVSVALVIQHAMSMRRVILSVACPALPHFSTRYNFLKIYLVCNCVFRFSLQLCLKYFSF